MSWPRRWKPCSPVRAANSAQISWKPCGSVDKGLVAGNDIFIIRTAAVPVALIEVGFMTNEEELTKLNSNDYQKKVAEGIYQAILRAFEEGY